MGIAEYKNMRYFAFDDKENPLTIPLEFLIYNVFV